MVNDLINNVYHHIEIGRLEQSVVSTIVDIDVFNDLFQIVG